MPNETNARAWYNTHKNLIDTVEEGIVVAVEHMPIFIETTDNSLSARMERLSKQDESVKRFNHETLNAVVAHPHVLGVEVLYTDEQGQLCELGAAGSAVRTSNKNAVSAKDGILIDERQIGWGKFQSFQLGPDGHEAGNGTYRPGIEIVWSFVRGSKDTSFQIQLSVLKKPLP